MYFHFRHSLRTPSKRLSRTLYFYEYMPEEDNKADEDFHIEESAGTSDTTKTSDTDDSTQD